MKGYLLWLKTSTGPTSSRPLNKRGMKLRDGNPDVMAAFRSLDQAASKDGALDSKTKELMCMAIGIAIRCDGVPGLSRQGGDQVWRHP